MNNGTSRGISLATIKNIAYITMLIDHVSLCIIGRLVSLEQYAGNGVLRQLAEGMRMVGRLAFPLFVWMLVNGMKYTSNRARYMLRLLIIAIISEPCFDLAISRRLYDSSSQNVCITLLISAVTIYAYEWIQARKVDKIWRFVLSAIVVATACLITFALRTDYRVTGILITMAMYHINGDDTSDVWTKALKLFVTIFVANILKFMLINPQYILVPANWRWYIDRAANMQILEVFSIFIISRFNHNKGSILPRCVYYAFYPVHLLVIGIIVVFVFR